MISIDKLCFYIKFALNLFTINFSRSNLWGDLVVSLPWIQKGLSQQNQQGRKCDSARFEKRQLESGKYF